MKTILLMIALGSLNLWAQETPRYYEAPEQRQSMRDSIYNDIYHWCNDRLRILRRARQEASYFNYRGQYQRAINELRSGLIRAYNDLYHNQTPISQQMLRRGAQLIDVLEENIASHRNGLKAISYFMDKYIAYIEETMANLDIPYFTPGNCGYCNHRSNREFENALVELARTKLELANDTLIHSTRIVPIGPSKLYLKAMEVLSYYSKTDLENSLFANYYACQIRDLADVHYDLRLFNSNGYPTETQRMIYRAFQSIENIINDLSSSQRCY